jgi:hypothetical protein
MPMQRARRLASVAVVASLTVAGLSACRSDPSVAAYLGDQQITESQVQAVIDQAARATAAGTPVTPLGRADVVKTLLSVDVLTQVAQRNNVTLPADLQLSEFATMLKQPEKADYVRLYATVQGYVAGLRNALKSGPEPTDAELKQVYETLAAHGEIQPGQSEAQFKSALTDSQKQLLQVATGVQHEITDVSGAMRIRVNPRYQPAIISVLDLQTQSGQNYPLVTAPLGPDETTPVVDAR